jgi:DNA modification methylase
MLAVELGELSILLPQQGFSVELTGFEVPEIDVLLGDVEEEKAASRDDEPVEVPAIPVTKAGDVWTLGRHRIVCGDARDPVVLKALLGNEQADCVFTDPPYNVRVRGHVVSGNGRVQHDEFAMASGEMSDAEFADFLRIVLGNSVAVGRDGSVHFVCMDWRHIGDLIAVGKGLYETFLNLVVWNKSNPGMGSLYRSGHELIAVFKKGEAAHQNNVELGRHGRNRSNVWSYPGMTAFKAGRESELAMHPTVKPVALVADAIKDVTRRNAIVLDIFGGSGTTLIAAERTGRRGRLVEIDPRYVDTTIARFEMLTRSDAIHASGATFTEMAHRAH